MRDLVRYAVAGVFFAAALLKAIDLDAPAELYAGAFALADSTARMLVAWLVLAEFGVAGALVLKREPTRWVYGTVLVMLMGFAAASGYLWYRGFGDCGCFGMLMPISPAATLAKNALLAIGTVWLLFGHLAPAGSNIEDPSAPVGGSVSSGTWD